MLLLGQKRQQKDKFFNLHTAMQEEKIEFLVALFKDEEGRLLSPLPINLHEVVFNKTDVVETKVQEQFCKEDASITRLAKTCFQVEQKRSDGSGSNVCVYARFEPSIVEGLEGEDAFCERYNDFKKRSVGEDAGLVIALDVRTVRRINKCPEAASYLHEKIVASLPPSSKEYKYVRLDDMKQRQGPAGARDREEHPAFVFRLSEDGSKAQPKRRPSGAARLLKGGTGAAPIAAQQTLAASIASAASAQSGNSTGSAASSTSSSAASTAAVASGNVSNDSDDAMGAPTEGAAAEMAGNSRPAVADAHPAASPPRVEHAQNTQNAPPHALVLHSSEEERATEATDEQRAVWADAGQAMNAAAVQHPAFPGFPTLLMFDIDFNRVVFQRSAAGTLLVSISP
jgi:hypothetical protein